MIYILVDSFRILLISTFWQLEDANLELILDILCKVYQGEVWFLHVMLKFSSMVHNNIHKCLSCALIFQESLCTQFWDRRSYVDGPIRCFLFDLESEFPFRSVEFIRLLASLSEGSWPAECV